MFKVGTQFHRSTIVGDVAHEMKKWPGFDYGYFLTDFSYYKDLEDQSGALEEVETWLKEELWLPPFCELYVEGQYVAVHVDFSELEEIGFKNGEVEEYKGNKKEEAPFVLKSEDNTSTLLRFDGDEYHEIWKVSV
jgi:hypothetical protein